MSTLKKTSSLLDAMPSIARDAMRSYFEPIRRLSARHRVESDQPECISINRIDIPDREHEAIYNLVDSEDHFQVAHIKLDPGADLSSQHSSRTTHWIVVKGTARIILGDEVSSLTKNQSTYNSSNVQVRVENPGENPLELIKIQFES